MTITQLLVFSKIAEYRSFTKAGQVLNMTQPAVSHAISSLESELDVTLIIRDRKKGILLTEVGKRVLTHVREMLKSQEKIEQEVAAEKGLNVGLIRVGAFATASTYFLPQIIGSIQNEYPNIEFELYEGTDEQIKKWLESRVIDVGFVVPPVKGMDSLPLYQSKMSVALRKDHPLANQSVIQIQDLKHEPIIICKSSEFPVLDLFEQAQTDLNVKLMVQNANTMLNMVQEGIGLAIMTEISYLSLPSQVMTREFAPPLWKEIHLAVPSLKGVSHAVQLFIHTTDKLFSRENG
jgi:DNA-binding transcriptional LysR family regulator